MMKKEFEKLVGREVTMEQYEMFEELYMQSTMNKQEFAKSIKKVSHSLPKPKFEGKVLVISIPDNSGYYRTPNGCWLHTVKAELVDVDISNGKIKVRRILNSYELKYEADLKDLEVEWMA